MRGHGILARLSCGTTNRGPLATTCTAIGPHPGWLNVVTCTMSIHMGKSATSKKTKWKIKFVKTTSAVIYNDWLSYKILVTCLHNTRYKIKDTSYPIQVTRYRIQDTRYTKRDTTLPLPYSSARYNGKVRYTRRCSLRAPRTPSRGVSLVR